MDSSEPAPCAMTVTAAAIARLRMNRMAWFGYRVCVCVCVLPSFALFYFLTTRSGTSFFLGSGRARVPTQRLFARSSRAMTRRTGLDSLFPGSPFSSRKVCSVCSVCSNTNVRERTSAFFTPTSTMHVHTVLVLCKSAVGARVRVHDYSTVRRYLYQPRCC